jgi:serine/threonine protein phosphatase 1
MVVYTIGDIHGNYIGLQDVLKKCSFNNNSDTLISLGDIVDGGRRTKDVINRLLDIKHFINVQGNHDVWALQWMKTGFEFPAWWHQGGMNTAASYTFDFENVPASHIKFLENAVPYYIDNQNRVFVHGGFDPDIPIQKNKIDELLWDRSLMCDYAPHHVIKNYKYVFVGHTSTQVLPAYIFIQRPDLDPLKPVRLNNLIAMDTGGGWNGRLSIMNVDTFEFWQSEISANLQNTMDLLEESY